MTTTATKKAAKSPDDGVSPFSDVTDAQQQAAEDAQKPVEFDDDGNPKPQEPSEAVAKLADEQAVRAAAGFNGGGAWPEELLAKNYVEPGQRLRRTPEYTSHETDS
jgi:hypothetical protein